MTSVTMQQCIDSWLEKFHNYATMDRFLGHGNFIIKQQWIDSWVMEISQLNNNGSILKRNGSIIV